VTVTTTMPSAVDTTASLPGTKRSTMRTRLARGVRRWAPAVLVFVALVVVWEWAARNGHLPISVAAPSSIRHEFVAKRETLWYHVGPTLTAAVRGYVIAIVAAFGCASVAVLLPRTSRSVYTSAVVVSSVPLIALTPVLVLWLDRGDTVRTAVAALAGFFPILVGCLQGFQATDPRAEELFLQLAARPRQQFLRLRLPSSLPYVFAGLKAAAASAVLGAIIAEWSGGGGTRGLGQMMTNALFGFNVPQTWLTILTSAFLAVGFYAVVAGIERLVVTWDRDDDVGAP